MGGVDFVQMLEILVVALQIFLEQFVNGLLFEVGNGDCVQNGKRWIDIHNVKVVAEQIATK